MMNKIKQFIPLSVSSKFAICGLPLRMDTYKTCDFGCKYCFSNNRKIMEFQKEFQVGNLRWLDKKLMSVSDCSYKKDSFLDTLLRKGITIHCGGMSDPFQFCEERFGVTKGAIDICNQFGKRILFSTKSDTVYGANITPELHTFQLSITGCGKDAEPNVPDFSRRIRFFNELKSEGFRVGIRLQPFVPGVTTLDIVKEFRKADNFTIEGIKIVPQNADAKETIFRTFDLAPSQFTQMGLLNLKPEIRKKAYQPFIDYFVANDFPFSIADNDMHDIGTNYCCCGDRLTDNYLLSANTAMCKLYGSSYTKKQMDAVLENEGIGDCVCNHLFTSNRQEDCRTVMDFYNKRFYRKSSPFSPFFLCSNKETADHNEEVEEQLSLF